jgi:bacterioferritin-associated ferredoxin
MKENLFRSKQMYICLCHEVTDREIKHAAKSGAASMQDLRDLLHVGTTCGRCSDCVKGLLKESLSTIHQLELRAT